MLPPYDLRTPTRQNHDITLFKNFAIRGDQKIQFRVGVFNIFNRAFATTAVTRSDLDLDARDACATARWTTCRTASAARSNGVCDPTGGFSFTQNTHQQLQQDQHHARPAHHRVRAEVLLLVSVRWPLRPADGQPLTLGAIRPTLPGRSAPRGLHRLVGRPAGRPTAALRALACSAGPGGPAGARAGGSWDGPPSSSVCSTGPVGPVRTSGTAEQDGSAPQASGPSQHGESATIALPFFRFWCETRKPYRVAGCGRSGRIH